MKKLKEYVIEGVFDEEDQMKSIDKAKEMHEFFSILDTLDKIGHKSKYSSRKYDEDALGNKLNIGDLVYIKSNSSNKFEVDERFGIIYKIDKERDRFCGGTINVYVGKNHDFDKNLKFYTQELRLSLDKININNPNVIYNLSKTSCLSSSEVILVKKAKQISPATISKIL